MTALLLRASLRTVPGRALGLHVVPAVVLVAASWPALQHDSTALLVLRGVAVLLAAALALAVDEPGAALLDATPTPLVERLAGRLALCAGLVLPAWGAALAVCTLRGAQVPLGAVTLEFAALATLGLTVPLALRRWWRICEPAVVVGPLLLGVLLGAAHLPPALLLLPGSPLDPAWDAAHLRWAVLLLGALGALLWGLSDPATARVAGRRS